MSKLNKYYGAQASTQVYTSLYINMRVCASIHIYKGERKHWREVTRSARSQSESQL